MSPVVAVLPSALLNTSPIRRLSDALLTTEPLQRARLAQASLAMLLLAAPVLAVSILAGRLSRLRHRAGRRPRRVRDLRAAP